MRNLEVQTDQSTRRQVHRETEKKEMKSWRKCVEGRMLYLARGERRDEGRIEGWRRKGEGRMEGGKRGGRIGLRRGEGQCLDRKAKIKGRSNKIRI